MKNAKGISLLARCAALAMALTMALAPLGALAEAPVSPVSFILSWQAEDGTAMQSMATPLSFPGYENAYWLYADAQAVSRGAVLIAVDNTGSYAGGFNPPSGQPLSNLIYTDAGMSPAPETALRFDALDAQGAPAASYLLYISSVTDLPEAPAAPTEQPPVIDATVTLYYVDRQGNQVASPTSRHFDAEGDYTLSPEPADLMDGYTLAQDYPAQQTVRVSAGGADPAQLQFVYDAPQPAVQPAAVTVRYVDEYGNDISPAQTKMLEPGQSTVYPELMVIPEGYQPLDVEPRTVTVDENGANPSVVEFRYGQTPFETSVTVYYYNADRQSVASPREYRFSAEGQQIIYAEPQDLQAGYVLAQGQSDSRAVNISRQGAEPAVIEFYYELPAFTASVTVRYLNGNGESVASERVYSFDTEGQQIIYAEPQDLQAGYVLAQGQSDSRAVNISRQGAEPAVIEFYYELPAFTASVTVRYLNGNGESVASERVYSFDTEGQQTIYAEPQDLQAGYVLAQGQSDSRAVNISRQGAEPAVIEFYYELPEPVIAPPVDITVYYVDDQGNPLGQRTQTVKDGTNAVEAEPIEGYALLGESIQYVQVTVNGAEPSSLTFTYQKTEQPQETAAPAPKADFIDVIYVDEAGTEIYRTQAYCVEGEETVVQADLSQIDQTLYELADAAEKSATIDADGLLHPEQIVFQFKNIPQPVTAQVTLNYLTEDGQQVAESERRVFNESGTFTLQARADIPAEYALQGESSVSVTVSQDGTASPAEHTFLYKKTEATQPPAIEYDATPLENIYLHPHKDGMNVRSTPEISSGDSSNVLGQVNAADVLTPSALVVNGQGENWYLIEYQGAPAYIKQSVTVQMTAAQVQEELGITLPEEQTPPPADLPVEDMALNLWGETNAPQVKLRSKSSKSGDIVTSLNQGTQVWVRSQVINDGGEAWYEATVNGRNGFILASLVSLYDQAKSDGINAALPSLPPFAETQAPTPTATPTATLTATPTATPAATPTATPTASPTSEPAENTPAPTPTSVPTATPTAVPEAYLGYLLTTGQTALRTGANMKDDSILVTLPENTLLKALAQTYVDGKAWHHVDVYSNGVTSQSGFVPDSAVRRISPSEADQYLKTATPAPTPVVTQEPLKMTGYAVTLGDDVLLREYADPNARIARILTKDTIVMVSGQEYVLGTAWHLVSYSGLYGYIRADQLRMLSAQETQTYLSSLRRTEPPVQVTPEPVTPSSLSSYGYVNTDKVRLRKEATTNSSVVKMMNRNDFALVLGTVKTSDGGDWYRISQGGTEGYVMGRYLTVLKIGELESYLNSSEFRSSNSAASGSTGSGTAAITAVEDYNKTVWQNPNIQTSYEPFSPIATATPPVEAILSPAPTGTAGSGFVVEESPTLEPLATFEPMGTEVPVKRTSGGAGAWIAVGLLGVLGGGGYYGWKLYQDNQKRAAQRAAQRRQQAARAASGTAPAAGRPGVQPTQGAQTRPGQTPYAPPASAQPTSAYQPPRPAQSGQTASQGGTTAYRPVTPAQSGQTASQGGTTAYRPVTPTQPGQTASQGGTTAYRPVTPAQSGQTTSQGGTTAYRPVTPTQPGQTASQSGTTAYRPVTPAQSAQTSSGASSADASGAGGAERSSAGRRRRTDRYSSEDKA